MSFEANQGQAKGTVQFLARGAGYQIDLSPTKAALTFVRPSKDRELAGSKPSPIALGLNLAGANPEAVVSGERELEGKVNYLIGNDPAKWRTDIPTFGRVRYEEVYPGIDVVYYGNQQRLEYDFVVAPGRDPGAIALEFSGGAKPEIEAATGDLLLRAGDETIRQHAPVTYQMAGDTRRAVASRYAMRGGGRVGFDLASMTGARRS